MSDLPEFKDRGKRMPPAQQESVNGLRNQRVHSVGNCPAGKVFDAISDVPRLDSLRSVVALASARWLLEESTEQTLNYRVELVAYSVERLPSEVPG